MKKKQKVLEKRVLRKPKHSVLVNIEFGQPATEKTAIAQVQRMLDLYSVGAMQHVVDRAEARSTTGRRRPQVCITCNRDTRSPMFDGCMVNNCPRGFKPCL